MGRVNRLKQLKIDFLLRYKKKGGFEGLGLNGTGKNKNQSQQRVLYIKSERHTRLHFHENEVSSLGTGVHLGAPLKGAHTASPEWKVMFPATKK